MHLHHHGAGAAPVELGGEQSLAVNLPGCGQGPAAVPGKIGVGDPPTGLGIEQVLGCQSCSSANRAAMRAVSA
ncbi:hypothetical protein [Rhodococcus opacus]|uniref:hypothetical protein n=1 Tax=Rhodococcus opacus TaxID=37919 RepID=UPI0029554C29|nr:hypothetical protein [Rhodococcus opacus]MDV7083471.1 hypothetical protein [Rhodococcus opacus]